MRSAWVVVAGIAIVGFAVAVMSTRESSQPLTFTESSSGKDLARGEPVKEPSRATEESAHGDSVVQHVAPQRDFHEELKNSEDRWEFAASVLAEAKGGNGAAQYYLAVALYDCRAFDQMYFRDGNRHRTYDEVMQSAVKRGGISWEYVSGVFKRCKRLVEAKETPFGDPDEWMKAAFENGNPLAQAQTAVNIAWKARFEGQADRAREEREEARRLAFEALRTKDPAALVLVGDVASALDPRQGADNPHQWVWLLAACERGLDCSRQSTWYQFRCSADSKCQPYENGVVDFVRRETGGRFLELERRAKELNAKLDHDQFDDLGI
jgi:hypothetical protein